jgi:haloalkane dehalogenase
MYRKVLTGLGHSFRVIGLDHLGCGLSSKPTEKKPFTLKDRIDHVEAFCRYLGLLTTEASFHLMVHDWGGAIGLGLGVRHPGHIRRLVVMNSAAFLSSDIPTRIAWGKIPCLGTWLMTRWNLFARAALWMAPQRPLSQDIQDAFIAPYDTPAHRKAIADFVEDIPLAPSHRSFSALASIEAHLPTLQSTPMLLLWGLKDFCFHKGFLERWQTFFPHAHTRVYPHAGHYVLEDEAESLLNDLQEFLCSPLTPSPFPI